MALVWFYLWIERKISSLCVIFIMFYFQYDVIRINFGCIFHVDHISKVMIVPSYSSSAVAACYFIVDVSSVKRVDNCGWMCDIYFCVLSQQQSPPVFVSF